MGETNFGFVAGVIILCAFAVLYLLSRSARVRGILGERRVRRVLGKSKAGEQYVLNDLRFCDENGKTCQIDHVLINHYGIFVIETKNYSGRIYGKERQLEWTQTLNYGKTKNKFYNPVRQNDTHVYYVNRILEARFPVYSAVVFVQGNLSHICSRDVYSLHGLRKLIRWRGDEAISANEMEEIRILLEISQSDVSTREHVRNIAKMKKQIEQRICPRCSSPLVLRSSPYGSFWGCAAYPACRFRTKK